MKSKTVSLHIYYMFLAIALLLPVMTTQAQTSAQKSQAPEESKTEEKSGNDVEQLRSKLEQLQSLVEQQQRAMTEMQKRIDDLDGRARAAVAPASLKVDAASGPQTEPRTASLEVAQTQKNDPPSSPAARDKDKDKPVVLLAGWDRNHAVLRSADGAFETQLTGYGQLDFRGYQSGSHPPNTFLVRRARLALEGKVQRYFDYKVEGDFADTAGTLLRDFYVRIHRTDGLQFSFGQFRVPISQEEIRSDAFQDFVERSMVNNLVPSRSPGLMASGVIDKGVFEYQIGSFNGKGLLAQNNNGTPENAIRLRFAPWRNGKQYWAKGFIFGGAFTQGRSFGGTSVRGQTESRSISWFVPDTINGKYIRANGEFTWMLGPAALRAEYDQTNQQRQNLGPGGRDLPGVVAKGYTAQFTYLLTGESKPEAGAVTPKHNLFGDESGKTGFGAWELKLRYTRLQISDATAKSNHAETIFFGPNIYFNRFVRYMLDLGFERFNDPARAPNPRDRNFFVVLSRIQVAF